MTSAADATNNAVWGPYPRSAAKLLPRMRRGGLRRTSPSCRSWCASELVELYFRLGRIGSQPFWGAVSRGESSRSCALVGDQMEGSIWLAEHPKARQIAVNIQAAGIVAAISLSKLKATRPYVTKSRRTTGLRTPVLSGQWLPSIRLIAAPAS